MNHLNNGGRKTVTMVMAVTMAMVITIVMAVTMVMVWNKDKATTFSAPLSQTHISAYFVHDVRVCLGSVFLTVCDGDLEIGVIRLFHGCHVSPPPRT